MNLEKIQIEGLYGIFNHTVKFNNVDKITVIIGQNGYGKTIILKMIKAFFSIDLQELKSFYFSKFTLFFSENREVVVTREISEDEAEVKIQLFKDSKAAESAFNSKDVYNKRKGNRYRNTISHIYQGEIFESEIDTISEVDMLIENVVPNHIRRVGTSKWVDMTNRREYSSYQILERFRHRFPKGFVDRFQIPVWLQVFADSQKTRMIETQRLLYRIKSGEEQYKSAVTEFSKELIETIKTQRAAASDLASKLDRSYPNRLLDRIRIEEHIESSVISRSLQELEAKRDILHKVGLIETSEQYMPLYVGNVEGNIASVLKLYIEDSNSKLSIYESLADKLGLFVSIINKRFLYKTLKIDTERGFIFNSTVDSSVIPVSSLSSGEQHELVLFYQLLFHTTNNMLLLIDEPEISLHISWQKQFIDDLKNIIKVNPIDVVIATHSPDIIGKYWEFATELEGPKSLTNNDK